MQPLTVLRIARPTNDLDSIIRFYREGLGLQELCRFENHDGFDGVMLGRPGETYHFEFTRTHGHDAGRAPTEDNLVAFYLPDRADWNEAVARMKQHGYAPVRSFNPYWDREGVTFEDHDGYRIVLQNAEWRFDEADQSPGASE
jgi:catechol 2,3-dioxygenase-like lactoylglutathione lyase family enzyme